ncbi:MAG: CDP-diacylglycerol--glycerol-3-phosphate 3-phosphatidyltransferase, partial [Oscillospiraceae bacterium]
MNLPNKLTVLRICLIPLFLFFLYCNFIPHNFLIALVVFGAASFTDMLDGKIARKHNLVTDFGKFMDPLADKLLVISAMIAFVGLNLASSIVVIIILAREFLVTSLRLVAANSGVVIAADKWGKYKTVSQMMWVSYIMLSKWIVSTFSVPSLVPAIN